MAERPLFSEKIYPVLEEGKPVGLVIEGAAPFARLQRIISERLKGKESVEFLLFYSDSNPVTIDADNFEEAKRLFREGGNPNDLVNGFAYQLQHARRGIIMRIINPSEQQSAPQTSA